MGQKETVYTPTAPCSFRAIGQKIVPRLEFASVYEAPVTTLWHAGLG